MSSHSPPEVLRSSACRIRTGANSPTTRERMPRGEAEHYRARALELGVPAEAILVEPKARNTGENIRFTRALVQKRGVVVRSALLVSKPYEERRAYATARKLWPEIKWISTSASVTFPQYVESLQDSRLVIDMLGVQQRLMVYPMKGFMLKYMIPDDIEAALDRLCASGFTNRLSL
ncbi:YdcF family protein [Actinacidiphila alni]|uniref:YdcF family protein n=1 Tax=Actinacidiphila alni TaxID=380248 RepID=UPI0033C63348